MRKLLVIVLSAAICLSLFTVSVSAASVDKMTVSAAAMNMMGALQGDGSGDLNLDGTLTRAQFCKIAVVVLGLSKSVSQYAGYTIFPDVPSGNWAAGYVNLAVRSAGIMSGYPDGSFGPDDIITYGQAVTVLMKMLGYSTTDVGAVWPDGFMAKADDIGLTDGVSLTAGSPITRGNAAVLFVNLLNTEMNGSTKKYMTAISGATVISNVFLVSANATTDDGTEGAVKIAGSAGGTYLPAGSVPDALRGIYGSLVLSSSGKALIMVPAKSGKTVVSTVAGASSGSIKCADGTKVTIPSTASFYLNGTSEKYTDSWVDIEGGMLVSAYYSDGGTVQSVLVASADSVSGDVAVVTADSYSIPSTASVYINGVKATSSDIEKYDVISDNGSGLYNVTRNRITGRYDDASPNTDSPDTVRVLGTEFTVLDSAVSSLGGFEIGDSITLLLTSDNKVAGVVPGSTLSGTNYGVVTSLASGAASVKLTSGVTVSGTVKYSSSDLAKGSFVSVGSYDASGIALYTVSDNGGALPLNVGTGTLGSMSLSKAVKIFDCVGYNAVSETSLSNIPATTVDASKIKFYATDPAGYVSLLLLNDVTGDCYTYGFIKNGSVTQTSGSLSATNSTTSVTNSDGATTAVLGGTGLPDGTPAGIAATGSGTLAAFAKLTSVTGISRSSFQTDTDGKTYVKTTGGLIPVADSIQAYISSTATWTTLAKARSYSDNLTIYYDKTMSTGKVRVVIAN